MSTSKPKDPNACRRFFLEPRCPKHRQYEALRAYFVEGQSSAEIARTFGYTPGSFRVLCHHFRRETDPHFFVTELAAQKGAIRDAVVALWKRDLTDSQISAELEKQDTYLSPNAIRKILLAARLTPRSARAARVPQKARSSKSGGHFAAAKSSKAVPAKKATAKVTTRGSSRKARRR